jgi:ubiquinone/menaquinone biosynthesis C-methylase UbiE
MSKRQAFFNQAAENWDKEYDNPQLQAFLKQFVPSFDLLAGQNVLDVGTGTGILISFLYRALGSTGHITAIDYAQNMVNICKNRHAQLPNLTVMVANAENLQFPNQTFDAVTCFGLFPHLENKKAVLQQFYRVLKPNGKLIIAHALGSQEIKNHHQNAPPEIAQDELPDEDVMRRLLHQAGFENISIVDKTGCYLCISTKAN